MDAFKVRSRARGFETEETFSHCLHGTLVTFKWKIKCHSAQSEFNEQKSKASKGVNFVDMWAFIDFNKINTRRFNSKSKQKTVQLLKLFSHRFAPRVVERGEWELRIEKPISINKKSNFLWLCVCLCGKYFNIPRIFQRANQTSIAEIEIWTLKIHLLIFFPFGLTMRFGVALGANKTFNIQIFSAEILTKQAYEKIFFVSPFTRGNRGASSKNRLLSEKNWTVKSKSMGNKCTIVADIWLKK